MISAEVTSPDLVDLAVAIKYEENGAVMRREFARNLRAAVRPAAEEAKSSIMTSDLLGLKKRAGTDRTSLRVAIRKQVGTQVSLTARQAKVTVRVRKRDMPRNFKNAPKAWSLPQGWRHPVLGSGGQKWVPQIGKPGWFDIPLRSHREQYRRAVQDAAKHTADRIARKV
jgi:hypothetical protein